MSSDVFLTNEQRGDLTSACRQLEEKLADLHHALDTESIHTVLIDAEQAQEQMNSIVLRLEEIANG